MIVEATTLLLAGLNQYLNAVDGNPVGSAAVTILGNPAQIDTPVVGPTLENQVLLTLVNLEEEAAPKNGQTVFIENGGVMVIYRNLELYCAF